MDDLKREIYMLARKLIEDSLKKDPGSNYGICCALVDAWNLLYGKGDFYIEDVPQEFPEFANLNDGVAWIYENYSNKPHPWIPKYMNYWWDVEPHHESEYGKISPRISMLDHILSK